MEEDLKKELEIFFEDVKKHLTHIENRISTVEKRIGNKAESISEKTVQDHEKEHTLLDERTLDDERMGLEDAGVSTRLLGKEWSPLIVRKTYVKGWPMWIGLITDANLNDLDVLTQDIIEESEKNRILQNNIQSIRNFCGYATERIVNHYNSKKRGVVEGCAVIAYWDKCFCSSLWGDVMVHGSCRAELYSIINILPHI